MNKGFVLSFSTFLIVSFLLLFAFYYAGKVQRSDSMVSASFGTEKAGFVADDIDADFNRLLGTRVSVSRSAALSAIFIKDRMPPDINKSKIQAYDSFAENVYAGQQNASISLATENLSDGRTELLFSNGLEYDYNYGSSNIIRLYAPNSDSNALSFDINVNINASSTSFSAWAWQDATGDLNVNLNFVDQNVSNEVHHSGKVDSSIENVFTWNYSGGGAFILRVGNIGGNLRALQAEESFADSSAAHLSVKSVVPFVPENFRWFYNADMNYSQGSVSLNRKILERHG
ncbi:MAG TPA: hypothetical protein VFF09_03530 [archaeon]|nr:hypothetical protein [archaeon]